MEGAALRVFVVAGRVVGAPDDDVAAAALALARQAGVGLLGLAFEIGEAGPTLVGVSLTPDLFLGGAPALLALRDALQPTAAG